MILTIDCGSTSFKAAVFDKELNVVSEGGHKLSYVYPGAKCVELEPGEVFSGFGKCLRDALDGVDASSINAIAFTSQAQTFSVFDSKDSPKCNFISWLDQRADTTCEELKMMMPDFGEHCSFGKVLSALQMCLLKHQLDAGAITVGKSDKVVSLVTALMQCLCGEYCLDNNLAAMQGFYSLRNEAWLEQAFGICGIGAEQQARVVGVGQVAARTSTLASEYGLPEGIPIIPAGNDQTAGAYGVELHLHETILVTLGTAYVVYGVTDSLPAPSRDYVRGVYPGGLFYCMGADNCGASITDWAANIICPHQADDPDALFDLAALSVKGADGVVFNPLLVNQQGAWQNIGIQNNREDLARAVLDSLVERVALMVKTVSQGHSLSHILAAGGHSKSACYLEMLKEATGVVFKPTKANPLLGAARMAVKAIS